jgi:hypothetical protein
MDNSIGEEESFVAETLVVFLVTFVFFVITYYKFSRTVKVEEDTEDDFNLEESIYLDYVQKVIHIGNVTADRTGVGTHSCFGCLMDFDLRDDVFPLLTTKKMFVRGIIGELLWMISGSTDATMLSKQRIRIWDANASRETLDSLGFADRKVGDLGPVYVRLHFFGQFPILLITFLRGSSGGIGARNTWTPKLITWDWG